MGTLKPSIFISYSHQDMELKEQLVNYLKVFEFHIGNWYIWDDSKIGVGEIWQEQIENALNQTSIALLLVTVNFLNSSFIRKVELPRFLLRREQEGMRIFPIIATDCPWQDIKWLSDMLVRPQDGEPIWGVRSTDASVRLNLTNIAREVNTTIQEINSQITIKVLLCDDYEAQSIGYSTILNRDPELKVNHAYTQFEVYKQLDVFQPDVLILEP
ncbi:MAG: toll/interleukin-1 receptor domain-containing protein [Caldilineaceae bacterium]